MSSRRGVAESRRKCRTQIGSREPLDVRRLPPAHARLSGGDSVFAPRPFPRYVRDSALPSNRTSLECDHDSQHHQGRISPGSAQSGHVADRAGRADQRRAAAATLRRGRPEGQPRGGQDHGHLRGAGRVGPERISPHLDRRRLRGARRHRLRPQTADARLLPGTGQAPAGPADQGAGFRSGLLRRHPEGRSAAAGQVHSQRASADHRAGAFAPQLHAGGGAADFAARRTCARTCRSAWPASTRSRRRSSSRSPA